MVECSKLELALAVVAVLAAVAGGDTKN